MAAAFLPTTLAEAHSLGWAELDVVIVTGDAYVDHPSFGAAVIGRLWESMGLRVGILPQPDWSSAAAFQALGRPKLFFGVTAGNMDSMVNRYTSDRRLRHNDAYTPNDEGGKRPDRAALVYAQRCREAFRDVPIVLGGIEASLRRAAQYDYWSDTVRRSILFDAKADILVYGNGETAAREIARRALAGEAIKAIDDLRGTAIIRARVPEGWAVEDWSDPDQPPHRLRGEAVCVRLPSYEQVKSDSTLYAVASRALHLETNPGDARPLVQRHGDRELWINPPPIPLDTSTLDAVFELPYARAPHPRYGDARIPAWEMIRFSVQILRGCFGGCSFCSITEHEGRQIQSRSEESVLREIAAIRDKTKGFTGVISDVGGPTANMWRLGCNDPKIQNACRRPSCLHPDVCKNLNTDHGPLIALYRKARSLPGIKKVFVASGVRYDLANRAPEYVRELARHHVGGYLKVAPEHVAPGPLSKMLKPGIEAFERFQKLFAQAAQEAGKDLYLIPYFIAAHPGTSDEDMLTLALWLKARDLKVDQVQTYLPSPMALATAMHHSGRNPLRPIRGAAGANADDAVFTAKGLRQRRLHKAFLRWHDPENWPILRDALKQMGRSDLIGAGPGKLVPADVGRSRDGGGGGGRSAASSGAPRSGASRPGAPRPGARPAAPKRGVPPASAPRKR